MIEKLKKIAFIGKQVLWKFSFQSLICRKIKSVYRDVK